MPKGGFGKLGTQIKTLMRAGCKNQVNYYVFIRRALMVDAIDACLYARMVCRAIRLSCSAWHGAMKELRMRKLRKIQGLNQVTYWTWAIGSGVAFAAIWILILVTMGAF
jgi:hypothetical protein